MRISVTLDITPEELPLATELVAVLRYVLSCFLIYKLVECGGKSPLIVFEDADLDNAITWAHSGIMDNSGQVCTSTSRIYVHEAIYDEFLKRLIDHTKEQAHIGGPFESGVSHGPQVSRTQYDKVLDFISKGKAEGAQAITGGDKVDREGYFVQPTIFTDVSGCRLPISNTALM